MRSLFDRLDGWGASFRGDRRLFAWGVGFGSLFFVVVRVTMSFATGAPSEAAVPAPDELAAGGLAFGAFWGGAGILAASGLPRLLFLSAAGHLTGYVVAALNVANAARHGFETALPLLTLVEFTLLGLVAGAIVEGALATRRRLLRRGARARAAP